MLNRINLSKLTSAIAIGISAILFSGCATNSINKTPPNILFIFIDDLNADITSYGGPIKTPYLDELAAGGAKFTRAYVQQPVCSASRASILAGLRPSSVGVDYPYSYYFMEEILPKHGIISDFFDERGYYVKQYGKIHHGIDNEYQGDSRNPQKGQFVSDETNENARKFGRDSRPPYEMITEGDENFADYAMTTAVIEELESVDSSKPFLIMAGLKKPHLPFSAPKEFWDLYNRDDIEVPVPTELAEGAPNMAVNRYYLNQYNWETDNPNVPFSDDYAKLIRHSYYASTSFIDAQIGRMMEALRENDLEENTIVFVLSDHGFLLGEQNYWGKTNLFEMGLKVPFIVYWKGKIQNGLEIDALVEAVDLFPTMADLAGFEIPEYLEGTSVMPLINDPTRTWKSGVYSQQERMNNAIVQGVSLRTNRYRFTEWIDITKGEVLHRELYDYEADPTESKNLVIEPSNNELVQSLSALLHEGWKAKLPDGIVNNSDNPVAPPSYAWGTEGASRRTVWHQAYGGSEEDGWKVATQMRLEKEGYPKLNLNGEHTDSN
ncbi:MAG: sulfatase [Balneola sp.]